MMARKNPNIMKQLFSEVKFYIEEDLSYSKSTKQTSQIK